MFCLRKMCIERSTTDHVIIKMDATLNELFFFLKSSNYWFYFAINFTIIITVYLIFSYSAKREPQLPPSDVGWFPWLGCAIAFGKNPLHYINASKEKVRNRTLFVLVLVDTQKGSIRNVALSLFRWSSG